MIIYSIVKIKSGDDFTLLLTDRGKVYSWGKNELVSKESIMEPILFTYFIDNDIEVKYMNRTKSARKN